MNVFSKEFQARLLKTLVFTISLLLMANLLAGAEVVYTPPPSHNCLRPVAPFQFTSQWQKNQYRKDAQAYMNCLKQFVEEQKEAIRRHQETIRRHKEAAKQRLKSGTVLQRD